MKFSDGGGGRCTDDAAHYRYMEELIPTLVLICVLLVFIPFKKVICHDAAKKYA